MENLEWLEGILETAVQYVRDNRGQFEDAERRYRQRQRAKPEFGSFNDCWYTAREARDSKRVLFLVFLLYGDLTADDESEHISTKYIDLWTKGGWGKSVQYKVCCDTLARTEDEARRNYGAIAAALEAVKKPAKPKYPMSLKVAAENFQVSTATLKRMIETGKLKSYRPENAPDNTPHIIDATELAALKPRRG